MARGRVFRGNSSIYRQGSTRMSSMSENVKPACPPAHREGAGRNETSILWVHCHQPLTIHVRGFASKWPLGPKGRRGTDRCRPGVLTGRFFHSF
jgi:hypothetical protein